MNLKNILWVRNTGKILPDAPIADNLFGMKVGGGGVITTATGNPVSIITNKAQNAISTILSYSPKQSGSGTPSPTNIRPIEGWTEAKLHVNEETLTIPLGGTYYEGTIDLERGTLTATHIKKKIGDESITWNYQSSGGRLYTQSLNTIIVKAPSNQTAFPEIIKCTCYKTVSATSTGASTGNLGIAVSNTGAIYLRDENYSNARDFVRDMGDEYILYQLDEPQTIPLTPQTVALLAGANTLWCDGDEISITYTAKK